MTPQKNQSQPKDARKPARTGGLGRGLSALFGTRPEPAPKAAEDLKPEQSKTPMKPAVPDKSHPSGSKKSGNPGKPKEAKHTAKKTTPEQIEKSEGKSALSANLVEQKAAKVAHPTEIAEASQPQSQPQNSEDIQRVLHVALSSVQPNANQPRSQFQTEAIEELAQSIRNNGILQPILVHELEAGRYEIIAGERRWRAASLAGLKQIPILVRQSSPERVFEEALIENIQRQDLNPLEEALALRRIQIDHKLTQEALASRVGKSRPAVANALRLLELGSLAQQAILSGQLSAGHGRALLRLTDLKTQETFTEHCIMNHLSVRDAEHLAEEWLRKQESATSKEDENSEQTAPPQYLDAYALSVQKTVQQLEQILGLRVQLKDRKHKGGRLILDYQTPEQREQILEKLLGRSNNLIE